MKKDSKKQPLDIMKIAEDTVDENGLFTVVPNLVSYIDFSIPGKRAMSESKNGKDLQALMINHLNESNKVVSKGSKFFNLTISSIAKVSELENLPDKDWQFIYDVVKRSNGIFEAYVETIEKYEDK